MIVIDEKKRRISLNVRDFLQFSPLIMALTQKRHFQVTSVFRSRHGTLFHQHILKKRRIIYDSQSMNCSLEFFLRHTFSIQSWTIVLRGRIDLLAVGETQIFVEELKTISDLPPHIDLKDPQNLLVTEFAPYVLQLQLYSFLVDQIYAAEKKTVSAFLLLYELNTSNLYKVPIPLLLKTEFYVIIKNLLQYIDHYLLKKHNQEFRRKKIAQKLRWPFRKYRTLQKQMKQELDWYLPNKRFVLVNAPTGTGKSWFLTYYLLKFALTRNKRLIITIPAKFLQSVYRSVLAKIVKPKVGLRVVFLSSHQDLCYTTPFYRLPDQCHDKTPSTADLEMIKAFIYPHWSIIDEHVIKTALTTLGTDVCAYKVMIAFAKEADVIVADFNYFFFNHFIENLSTDIIRKKQDFILYIDEVHQLPQRGNLYYSTSISLDSIEHFINSVTQIKQRGSLIGDYRPFLKDLLEKAEKIKKMNLKDENNTLDEFSFTPIDKETKKQIYFDDLLITKNIKAFLLASSLFSDELLESEDYTALSFIQSKIAVERFIRQLIFAVNQQDHFRLLFDTEKKMLELVCLDSSPFIWKKIRSFSYVVGSSATIPPIENIESLLGFSKKTIVLRYDSPFKKEQVKTLIVPTVDTSFELRDRFMPQIAEEIVNIYLTKPDTHYIVMLPNTKMCAQLQQLIKRFKVNAIIAPRSASTRVMHDFFETLKNYKGGIILSTLGSTLTEGLTLPVPLGGIIIVGPGLVPLTTEKVEQIRLYERKYRDHGFEYAIIMPSMIKITQSIGRLIRSSHDRGVVIFLGRRFLSRRYLQFIPKFYFESSDNLIVHDYLEVLKEFWQQGV